MLFISNRKFKDFTTMKSLNILVFVDTKDVHVPAKTNGVYLRSNDQTRFFTRTHISVLSYEKYKHIQRIERNLIFL